MKNLNLSKRLLCVIIAFSVATFIGITFVSAENEGLFQYHINGNEVTITKCDPSVSGHLDIPETLGGLPVKSITSQAFWGCSDLTSVTIPSGVHSLYGSGFAFSGLTTITIPKTLVNIGNAVFEECYSLTEITVEEGNPNYISIDGVLFTKDLTKLMQYPCGKTDIFYSVPHGVESIDAWSFAVNPYLKEVVLPDTVVAVGEFAFYVCENLIDITVPSSVTQIDKGAFGWSYNREQEIYVPIDCFALHGYAGTAAERYCMEYADYGFAFDVLNKKGDGNHDDEVNAKDALLVLQLAVGKVESTPGYIQVTDVNSDNLVNSKDALEILKKSVGKPSCF